MQAVREREQDRSAAWRDWLAGAPADQLAAVLGDPDLSDVLLPDDRRAVAHLLETAPARAAGGQRRRRLPRWLRRRDVQEYLAAAVLAALGLVIMLLM